ncbi:transcriptional regulator [Streptomyces sp. ICBB 8177]|nr:transcriptional regulator [Streptomyces sp. ICBB 8177]
MSTNPPANGRPGQPKFGWDFFGEELKRLRETAGLTQQDLGQRVFCSGSYIGQFEAAIRKPQLDLARRFDTELGAGGIFERMCKRLIDREPWENYFTGVAELQGLATTICEYGAQLIPGLLQTEGYARGLFRACQPFQSEREEDEFVQNRMARRQIFEQPTPPELWEILDESALRRPVGSDLDMAEQLDHLVALIEARKVVVQVIPFSARAHALQSGALMLMTFDDAPPVAYAEGVFNGQLLDHPHQVRRCQAVFDFARAAAMCPEESLALIRTLAKEYRKNG